jgi:glycosyltransferase involved in cell wall biosynthesis
MKDFRGIAFVGTYLPRACGLATFTYDLAEAVAERCGDGEPVIVAAMNDRPEGYVYPDRVTFELREGNKTDYTRAADFLNYSRIDVVCLQHEFNIFGGQAGSNILSMLRDLHRPVVVTCHTVLRDPDAARKEVLREIGARADKLVAMSKRACRFLEEIYDVPREKIALVPHGIHDMPFVDPSFYKDKFGMEGRRVLLTFGLLHDEKGIEYMIEAMPTIVEKHPRVSYIVLGATHPAILREEGESYRLSLQRRVRTLGLEEHVIFYPRFVELDDLLEYLGASDILVTPYVREDHTASGPLIYAMGAGKAVVSTPYWYAREMLGEGRGRLVPAGDAAALAREIIGLLDDEVSLGLMRKKAYNHCRCMVWRSVAEEYLGIFDEARRHLPLTMARTSSVKRPLSTTNLPQPRIEHLERLSDDTGPLHHALYSMPDRGSGYLLDDASVMLVVCAKHQAIFGDADSARLAARCLGLIQYVTGPEGNIASGLDYTRKWMGPASEVAVGKAVWALGYVVSRGHSMIYEAANDTFQQLIPYAGCEGIRAAGHAVLGASGYLVHFPGATEVRRYLRRQVTRLEAVCRKPDWIAAWNGVDWPVAAQSLIVAGDRLGRDNLCELGRSLLGELLERTSHGTLFLRAGENPDEEEIPTTASTFIEALGAEYKRGRDRALLEPMRAAADWFLGANRLGKALYDFKTAGCHDALSASGLNPNQGLESSAYWLLALLTLQELAGSMSSIPPPPAVS